jgi:hypothetical protein
VINYEFLMDKSNESASVDQSDGNRAGTLIAQFNGRVEVESTVTKVAMDSARLGLLDD